MAALRPWVDRALVPVRADLSEDPYLRYLLVVALVCSAFGVWFRLPNFAAPDEYSRLIQPMKVAGGFVADPGIDSLVAGVTDGRALGATFYLYSLVLAPVFLVVLATGQLGEFATLGTIESRWTLWHAAPAWFWTATVLLARLVSVALGVACVYLTYRLGVELRDRFTGRLAALLLALSVGFLAQTHVVGEDLPMLALLVLTVLLARRYVASGRVDTYLFGALTGGLAIAFKLSGGAAAVVLGVAHVERACRADDPLDALLRPRVVLGGLVVGIATIYVAVPSVLVGGPGELLVRATGSISSKTTRTGGLAAPVWYWLLRGAVQGLGLPLVVGVLAAWVVAAARAVRRRAAPSPATVLVVTTLAVFLLVYSRWEFVRIRHLVPLFPFALVLFAAELRRWWDHDRAGDAVRVGLGVVLLSSVVLAGAAEVGYVTEPRDRATDWLATNADENATVEVYENSIADVAAVHGWETSHYDFPEENATNRSSLVGNESAFTEWMLDMPDREPEYVQLTANEMDYLDPTDPDYRRFPRRRAFVRGLLDGEYNYTVAAEFGEPRRVDTLREDFIEATLSPEVDGQASYVVILERTEQRT